MIDLDVFRGQAREWLRQAAIPDAPMGFEERFKVLREWQRTLFDAGWMGIAWPVEVGGRGLSPRHQFTFAEELVRARAPMPIGLIGLDVVGPTITRYGTEEQRTSLLPRLLSGDDIWCQGFSEPGAGSDLASLRTSARQEGDEFVVSGQKVWTSWAGQADRCALLVRTDPGARKHKGISYLLVDMRTPGIEVRPLIQMTGDGEFCEVFFDDVRVPAGNLLGRLHEGWPIAMHTLGTERGEYTLRRRVNLEVSLEDVIADVRREITERPASPDLLTRVAAGLGRSYVAARALEGQTRKTVQRLVDDTGPTPEDSVDKLLLTEIEQRVFGVVADLLGPFRVDAASRPLGLETDRWVYEHYYSRAASIYGGTSQIQKNIIAERLLGLPRG